MEKEYSLGFDIGGTKCAVILGRRAAGGHIEIIGKMKLATRDFPAPYDCLAKLAEHAVTLLKQNNACLKNVHGGGISCGGPLDSRNGIIMSPPNLPGWDNIWIVEFLKERLQIPLNFQNDANAGALAEWKFGAGQGTQNMIFLTFGTGLGAGLILNGRLYSGANDMAGECGHLRLASFGPVGYGKAGSFEGFCSGGGIAQLARTRICEKLQAGCPVAWCPNPDTVDAKTVADAAAAGDPLALAIYAECGTYLGRGLSMLIDILNPERIVIGSIFARSEHFLRPSMERAMAEEALPGALQCCEVVPAALGEAIGDYAALALAD